MTCDECHNLISGGDVYNVISRPKRERRATEGKEGEEASPNEKERVPEAVEIKRDHYPVDIFCWKGSCLDVMMYKLGERSVDLIVTDLPYGTTGDNKTDFNNQKIDLNEYWRQVKRVLRPTGSVIMVTAMPFSFEVIQSNPRMFRYELIWEKNTHSKTMLAKYRPVCNHEILLVFSQSKLYGMVYNNIGGRTVIKAKSVKDRFHPTQKPVELFEWVIERYSKEGDTVLDTCAGSGTTGVACSFLNRNAVLVENFKPIYNIMVNRLKDECPNAVIGEFV